VNDNILLITPPDIIHNQSKSILMIYPGEELKKEYQDILAESTDPQNIYLYNLPEDDANIAWLLNVSRQVDTIILDLDNSQTHVRMLASYLISLPYTYWLTNEDTWCYSKLSMNRVYGLDKIRNLIGGTIEES
jgi:hypothetical protein